MSNLCEGASIDGSVVGHVCSGSKNCLTVIQSVQ